MNLTPTKVGAFAVELQAQPDKGGGAPFPQCPVTFVKRPLELVMLRHNPAIFYPR
jgi:hypothetical protein